MPDSSAPQQQVGGGPSFVLLEKGDPIRVLRPSDGSGDTKTAPLATKGFNSVIVDVIPGPVSVATTATILGSPSPGGPWVQEVDAQAFQSGIAPTSARRFIVTGISTWVAIALSNPRDWTVWLTPFNAASQTNVTVTGTSSSNVAQYGGVAVGPANPHDVQAADGALGGIGATGDAAVTTSAAGSLSAKLRGIISLLISGIVTVPQLASVQRMTCGFLAPGQSAKQFTGRVLTAVNLAVPTVPTLAAGAAGLPNGTYRCAVTFVTATGETSGGAEAVVTVANQQIAWSAIPVGPAATTARNLYRTQPGGAAGTERFVAQVAGNVATTYTDNVADATLAAAAAMPTVNTSSNTVVSLYTVTAAKTFLASDLFFSTDSVAPLDMRLQGGGVDIFRTFVRDTAPFDGAGIETQPNVVAGAAVTLLVPGTAALQSVIFTILGVEQ